jgi:heme A synthase
MNSFRPTPTMAHVTIAVALVGAAITIGLTIWESQKGKTRGPVIIDNQFVSHRQR